MGMGTMTGEVIVDRNSYGKRKQKGGLQHESEEQEECKKRTSTCVLGNRLVFCLALVVCLNALKSFAVYVLVRPVTAGLRSKAVGGDIVTMLSTPLACGGVIARCESCLPPSPSPAVPAVAKAVLLLSAGKVVGLRCWVDG